MKNLVTVRSGYSFDQFYTVLQKFAHEVAKEVVVNLSTTGGRIMFGYQSISLLETDKYSIRFSGQSRISFSRHNEDEYWGFEVEEKLYATSNHRTKLSYSVSVGGHYEEGKGYVEDGDRKAKEEKRGVEILEFIERLMTENAMKPKPRFSLSDMVQNRMKTA